MESMYKGLNVTKWVLIVWPKIPQMPQNLSAQFVSPSPKVLHFNEKRLHWASVVRAIENALSETIFIHCVFSTPNVFPKSDICLKFTHVLCIKDCFDNLTLHCLYDFFVYEKINKYLSKNSMGNNSKNVTR